MSRRGIDALNGLFSCFGVRKLFRCWGFFCFVFFKFPLWAYKCRDFFVVHSHLISSLLKHHFILGKGIAFKYKVTGWIVMYPLLHSNLHLPVFLRLR